MRRWAGAARGARTVALSAAVLLAAQAALSPAVAATTVPSFARADHQQLGNNHVLAHLNGDGRLDIAGQGAQSAAVLLNRGDGTFGARAEYPVADWNQDLAAGDFDGDGHTDLAVTINNPQTSVSLLRGRGDGTFEPATHLPNTTGLDSPAIVAADLNLDGRVDLAVAHSFACFTAPCVAGEILTVHLGNGDGTFATPRNVQVGRGMAKIDVADLDRDGIPDLAVAGSSSRLFLLTGVGDGSFEPVRTMILTPDTFGVEATDVDAADLDRDTVLDLVVAVALNGSRTAVLLGNGDGTFRAPLILTDPGLRVPHFQAVADYNLDGFLDLAMSQGDGTAGLLHLRNGNGDGTFQGPVQQQVPPPKSSLGSYAVVAGHLDADTRVDLTLGIVGAAPSFAVLLNRTGSAPAPVPTAPTLLSPGQDSTPAQPVQLDWSDVGAATAYRVQIDDSSDFSTPVMDRRVTASQLTAQPLSSARHSWRVRGVNATGVEGAWSSARRFTPRQETPTATLASLTLDPTSVVGGSATSRGFAQLSILAPSGGIVVTLSVPAGSPASVPASVTVPAGSAGVAFTVTTSSVSSSTPVTVTGTAGGVTRTAVLTVTPAAAPPPPPPPPPASAALAGVTTSPTTVAGGGTAQGTVSLTAAAPSGGFAVGLSDGSAAVTVPASVTVAAGATTATFSVTTTQVTASTPVTITAAAGGVTRTTTLTVTPPTPPPTSAGAVTVTATGRSGERILSSPTGLSVPVGSSGSASFPVGTRLTLSVSNGRDAIWSGACSSGGSKTRTCAFTLGSTASVTGNVQ